MQKEIAVVGLGPGHHKYLSAEALETLRSGKPIFLRTKIHPTVPFLDTEGLEYQSFDGVYEEKHNFEEVYQEIVEALIEEVLKHGEIIYAVPGQPWTGEKTVQELHRVADQFGFQIRIVDGISFLDLLFSSLKFDPAQGLAIFDAHQIENYEYSSQTAAIIMQVHNRILSSKVKLYLMERLEDDHEVKVVQSLGVPGQEKIITIPLYQLDHSDQFDHLTTVFVPATTNFTSGRTNGAISRLTDIMTQLRSSQGCPWDREQTHSSLKPYLIEEAYEVAEAVDTQNPELLCEELGDVLLQVVFHAQIASEADDFYLEDVINEICEKMVRRHPHVFADLKIKGTGEVLENWEKIKITEKTEKRKSILDGIPKNFPALMKAYKLQNKAAKVGFDWETVEGALEKTHEELIELVEAIRSEEKGSITEETGDLLFAVVNVARFLSVEPETALLQASKKFYDRFRFIEEHAEEKGLSLDEMSLSEMDQLWERAKKSGRIEK